MRRFLGVCAAGLMFAVLAPVGLAGRPLEVEDTGVAPQGGFELELGTEYISGDVVQKSYQVNVNLAYGLAENVEVDVFMSGVPYSNDGGDHVQGLEDFQLFGKWRFYGNDESPVAAALYGALSLPTGDKSEGLGSGEYDGSAALALSVALPRDAVVYLNGGYSVAQSEHDSVNLALAVEQPVSDAWCVLAEVVSDQGIHGGKDEDSTRVLVGVCWTASDKLAIDAALRFGLDNRTADFGAVLGAAYAF